MNNIILIGMPASGKSTAGVLLAKRAGLDYVDCDLVIQKKHKAKLSEIIEREGCEGFIAAEQEAICGIFAENSVISTGGSAVYGERAMAHLKTLGVIVYLKTDLGELEKRLAGKDIFKRGVIMRKAGESLKELYEERAPLYERYADITVDCSNLNLEQTVEAVLKKTTE